MFTFPPVTKHPEGGPCLKLGLLVLLLLGASCMVALQAPAGGTSALWAQAPRPSFMTASAPGVTTIPPGPLTWSAFPAFFSGPPRALAAVASYTALSEPFVAVVGGSGACGRYCNDSWTLSLDAPNGPQWFEGASPGPDGRAGASLGWDAADGELVLYGGTNGSLGALNQTWWKIPFRSGWNELRTGPLPPPRWGASFAYDPALGGLLLFGGEGQGGQLLSDTWVFRGNVWTELSPSIAPSARSGATLSWQAGHDRMVLFGGNSSSGPRSDTWAFGNREWYQLHPASAPPARSAASGSSDGQGDPVLFGGWGSAGPSNDTWVFYQDNWSEPSYSLTPPPMAGGALVPDEAATPNDLLEVLGRGTGGPDPIVWSLRVWNGGSPPPPTSLGLDAEVNVSAGVAPLDVAFQAFGQGGTPPYAYAWNFGDGTSAPALGVLDHTYDLPGDYLATLRVTDNALPPQTLNRTFAIAVSSPPSAFSATFTTAPRQGTEPLQASFVPTVLGGTGPFTYRWDFGDGTTTSTQVAPTHVFSIPGDYVVELRVNDSQAHTAVWAATVLVSAKGLGVTVSASPLSGSAPLSVRLTAQAHGGLAPYSYLWSFGNGNSTVAPEGNMTQVYADPGNYTVQVTVVDRSGTSASASLRLSVTSPPPFVAPPPTPLEQVARSVSHFLAVVLQPAVAALIVLFLVLGALFVRARAELPLLRAVRRASPRRSLTDRFLLSEALMIVQELRAGSSLLEVAHRIRPLVERDARAVAHRLGWRPGPGAVWLTRRLLLLPPQLLAATTVLFLGFVVVPAAVQGGTTTFAPDGGPIGFLTAWWAFCSGLFTQAFTSAYLEAYLPYTLQLMGLVVVISSALAYPLGMLSGWNRGRAVDHSTRMASVLANAIPIFVVGVVFTGWAWAGFYTWTGGDTLVGSLPSVVWDVQNMGGIPPWIALHQNTLPTGFVLVDAPLHGAWAFEQVVLLKMLLQAIPIATVYAAIFLRYARVATQEAAAAPSVTGARARGLNERSLLWKHTSRRIAPTYVEIFGASFPVLLSIQLVAEWFYGDLGVGRLFVGALGDLTSVAVSQVAFVLLVLVFAANVLGDGVARALDPVGRAHVG